MTKKCIAGLAALLLLVQPLGVSGETLADKLRPEGETGVSFEYQIGDDYGVKLEEYAEKGYSSAPADATFSVEGGDFIAADSGIVVEAHGDYPKTLVWSDETDAKKVEWQLDVPADGLYMMSISICVPDGEYADVVRRLTLDGEVPFSECSNVHFRPLWIDEPVDLEEGELLTKRPGVLQVIEWQTVDLYDTDYLYEVPLQFYLTKGTHKLGMEMISGSIMIGNIAFSGYVPPVSYETYAASNSQYSSGSSSIYFEAETENILYKNSNVIRMNTTGNPVATPNTLGETVMNVIGGTAWQSGGHAITYEIDVKSGGLYKMALHVMQNYRDGLPVYRRVEIDGEVPFEEMLAYQFNNSQEWYTETLTDDEGNPYLFYLSEGKHTITFTCTQGPMYDLVTFVEREFQRVTELTRRIRLVIGSNPDYNYDYELDRVIPDMMSEMQTMIDNMAILREDLKQLAGAEVAMYHQLNSTIDQIKKLMKDPFVIPRQIRDLDDTANTYSTWLTSFKEQPLLVDFVEILPVDTAATIRKTNFIEKLWIGIVTFFNTFVNDYSSVSAEEESVSDGETLEVWTARGADWALLIREMIEEDFTPQTGINVKLNILPSGQLSAGSANALMLAIASGNTPDVCLGTGVGEFAKRNVLMDLSQFDDFEEVKKWFLEENFITLTYKDGVYGMPENMGFNVMIYRKDILAELGLKIPRTWNELYNNVIPVLSQNNMQFHCGQSMDFFLYQLGGSYYNSDYSKTALDSEIAIQAMTELCDLFNKYGVPLASNFFNRFRTGEMPMGIIDGSTYLTFRGAAPELEGLWGIALIPGHEQEDGTIKHTYNWGAPSADVIMSGCKDPDSAWTFMKWWLSADVQTQYAVELESIRGILGRWTSANLEAFRNVPWVKEDLDVIMESVQDVIGVPIVDGDYYIGRSLGNAVNRCLMNGEDPRAALEQAAEEINKELERRQKGENS